MFSELKQLLRRITGSGAVKENARTPPDPSGDPPVAREPVGPKGTPPAAGPKKDPCPGDGRADQPGNRPQERKHSRELKVNRSGIPILPADADFGRLFGLEGEHRGRRGRKNLRSPPGVAKEASPPDVSEAGPSRRADSGRYNRHGLPVLDAETDWYRLFGEDPPNRQPGGDRHDDALAEADRRILARKRTGRPINVRRVGIRQRIRSYPPPQGQLDLHGFTSQEAEHRTESYLRSAYSDGRLTLRIIVGRGRHSSGGAVLPAVVENKLIELKRRGVVLTHRWEKGTRDRSGSVLVYLDRPE